MIKLKFTDLLPDNVRNELDQLASSLKVFLQKNHNDDGTHRDITADSLSIGGGSAGVWVDLPFDAARYTTDSGTVTWTVTQVSQRYLKYTRVGSLAIVAYHILTTTTATSAADKATGLIINIPELNIQPYDSNGQPITFHSFGAANTAADGHLPVDISAQNRTVGGGMSLVLERFNNIERGGASVQFGNWPNEVGSITVYGQIAFQTTAGNVPVSYLPL